MLRVWCLALLPLACCDASGTADLKRGIALLAKGDAVGSASILAPVLDRCPEHPLAGTDAWRVQYVVGKCLDVLGRTQDALDLLGPVVEFWNLALPESSKDRMIANVTFAVALRNAGRYPEALRIVKTAVRQLKETDPADQGLASQFLGELCTMLGCVRRYEEGAAACRESLALMNESGDRPAIDRVAAQNALAQMLYLQNDLPSALEAIASARTLMLEKTPLHPDLGPVEVTYGVIRLKQGHPDEAEVYLRSAIERFHRILGPAHEHIAFALENLAQAVQRQRRKEEAKQIALEASQMRSRLAAAATVSVYSMKR